MSDIVKSRFLRIPDWLRRGLVTGAIPAAVIIGGAFTSQPAFADCTQVNPTTVNCASPGRGGYVAVTDPQFVTVQPGTTVTDDGAQAISVNDSSTVTNNGLITVTSAFASGIIAGSAGGANNIIINGSSGVILVTGDYGVGILSGGGNTITNAGTIIVSALSDPLVSLAAGIVSGPNVGGVNDLITNTGTITVTTDNAYGILANNGQPTVINSGSISVTAAGIGIYSAEGTADNNGLIVASGAGAIGIQAIAGAGGNGTVTNAGVIIASGAGATALQIYAQGAGAAVINNSGSLVGAGAGSFALSSTNAAPAFGFTAATITNTGTIDGQISLTGTGDLLTNSGLITVTSTSIPIGGVFAIDSGDYVQTAGGTLALRVTAAAAVKDTLTITDGSATLAGTLRAVVQPGLYGAATTYAGVVTTCGPCGGITGNFDSATSSSPFFTASAVVNGLDIDLTLTRIAFNAVPGLTPNELAVANAVNPGYSTTLTGDAATFYSNLLAATSVTVLDHLSGEGLSATQGAAFGAGSQFNNAMQNQGLFAPNFGGLSVTIPAQQYAETPRQRFEDAFASLKKTPDAPEPGRWHIWTTGFGASRSLDGQASTGSSSQSIRNYGGAFGFDRQVSPDLLVGFAAGGSESSFSVSNLSTSGNITGGHIGAYAMKTWGTYYAAASLGYARFDNSTTRTITGVGPSETAKGRFDSDQLGGRLELGWKQAYRLANVTPFVAVEPAVLWQHGYTESSTTAAGSAGVLGLSVPSHTVTSLPTFLGIQADTRYLTAEGATFAPYARVSWVHEFEPNRQITASFISVPTATFTVDGARPAGDSARLDAGAKLELRAGEMMFANFTGEWSGRTQTYAASAGLRVTR